MSRTTRRSFAKGLVAAGAALPLAGAAAAPLQEPATPYARHLTPEEVQRVAKERADAARAVERLRAFELSNADEPDFTFHALAERW